MSLVNSEYPIDKSFNYQNYISNAEIPAKYENYVKEIAKHFYNDNKKITLSDDSVIFWLYKTCRNLIHHIDYTIFQTHIKTFLKSF